MSVRAIASMASIILLAVLVSAALAQQFGQAASTACASTRGSLSCPTYTAPAATAVPRAPMDGSMLVTAGTSTTLFNGAVPPNGFIVQAGTLQCFVNDNGPAGINAAFFFGPNGSETVVLYVTPPGYKPIGAVSVFCPGSGGGTYVAARGW
jgi:hypothetical protein